jgi:hypothetical protein
MSGCLSGQRGCSHPSHWTHSSCETLIVASSCTHLDPTLVSCSAINALESIQHVVHDLLYVTVGSSKGSVWVVYAFCARARIAFGYSFSALPSPQSYLPIYSRCVV